MVIHSHRSGWHKPVWMPAVPVSRFSLWVVSSAETLNVRRKPFVHVWEPTLGGWEGGVDIIRAAECALWGLNESQCALVGHHKQTMKNESGDAVRLLFPVGTVTSRHTYLW